MDFVRLRRMQREQLRAQVIRIRNVMGVEKPDLARGAYFGEGGIDAVQAGAGHEADVVLGLMCGGRAQSSAARFVPRNRPSLSAQLAVCCRKRERCAAASGGDPGSLTDRG